MIFNLEDVRTRLLSPAEAMLWLLDKVELAPKQEVQIKKSNISVADPDPPDPSNLVQFSYPLKIIQIQNITGCYLFIINV